ncbi:MAG: SDR family NAD(P)-dependent oxidoreductase [Acidimicrobiales bacterium]
MGDQLSRAVAIVGVGAIMPDAPDANTFWQNIKQGRYSISDVDPSRWDPQLYYDPEPKAPDKTYSKIGGWVRDWLWDPRAWNLALMPRVADAMDDTQKWAVACTHQALVDYGYPERPLDNERVAVVFGNAMAGERHYQTVMRISFPELAAELGDAPSFRALPIDVQKAIAAELGDLVGKRYPEITEDTMPGELSNCIAGRVANLFNFRGPNYVVDAACASAMAAMNSAVGGLVEGEYDAVITGGIDRNMGASTYVKFCKIGALSATGTRPYAEGADGFVMGEGAATFLLKRLGDAVRDGDRIYCVLLGMAGSSDGKGKGITAPNPIGQKLCVERAWRNAGVAPQTASLVEGHGTSTRVGDVVEHESMAAVFGGSGVPAGSIALGSVKSNIGHLKAGAGAAGIFKAVMAIYDKVLPPSLNFSRPNPDIDFANSPFRVNTELRDWDRPESGVRRAGVSAFGFGGTNFHAVLEEHVPEQDKGRARQFAVPEMKVTARPVAPSPVPPRRAAVIGAVTEAQLAQELANLAAEAVEGRMPSATPPGSETLEAPERIAIDYGSADELAEKVKWAQQAQAGGDAAWKLLQARGIFRGRGPRPKVAFLYTGQGSQYPNMLRSLAETDPLVVEVFDEADRAMKPLLAGRTLRDFLFVDPDDPSAVAQAEEDLRRTEITQPSVLTVDYAITRLLEERGFRPDFVMGHSLGEYGALVAAGALPFADALEAVSARGREMASLELEDRGLMAAVFAPLTEVERIVASVDGNVVIANINSSKQVVIGGASIAVEAAMAVLSDAGHQAVLLPVSHAFHTSIVAPASVPLEQTLARLRLSSPQIPVVANLTGDFYPMGPGVEPEMIEILGRQVASPVQFVKGLRTLYEHGARVFVEVGPKKALHGFAQEMFHDDRSVLTLFTNHPKWGDSVAFNQALCGLYAAGVGPLPATHAPTATRLIPPSAYAELGKLVADFLDRRAVSNGGNGPTRPVVVTGAALGLPGTLRVFDDGNLGRLLRGDQCISPIPSEIRDAMLDQHITRLVKGPDGSGSFVSIDDAADVIKLAGRAGAFDPVAELGIDPERVLALENGTCMAMAAGLAALRDAGIPLVQHYKTTHIGTRLPERWGLPDELRDDTGVIFAAAFPGLDAFAGYAHDYYTDKARREQLSALEAVRASTVSDGGAGVDAVNAELDRRSAALRAEIDDHPYAFDRRFLFRVLSMGHSQFAEFIGARGPNTQLNAACASTTQAITVAEDWIRSGRCRRVIVVAADNATSDNLLGWIGAGFLASGAAATDADVEEAATPFDRRRHGMIIGMGAVAIVLEHAEAAEERGIRPIAELLAGVTANSAFHGTRLDVQHISVEMEQLVTQAEQRWGLDRREMAPRTVFVSHETYTPARGGSAAAEIASLRSVFGSAADDIVIANTKGLTGHAMGAGIEDVVAVKSLETGMVPPIPNFKEIDPELGELNLSHGGSYPVEYAMRLAAGFGSQISMTLLRRVPAPDGERHAPDALGYEYRIDYPERWHAWLARVSGQTDAGLEVVQHQLRIAAAAPVEVGRMVETPAVVATAAVVEAPPPVVTSIPVEAAAPVVTAPVEVAVPLAAAAPVEPIEAAAPVEPVVAPPAVAEEEVRQRVLALVAEKTGYPEDMLALDLDLEADLGVDTVKQAELFATVREAYGIARNDNLKLRDYPTLEHVICFVLEQAGGVATAAAPVVTAPVDVAVPVEVATPSPDVTAGLGACDTVKRRVPVPILRPPLDLCRRTGVMLHAGTRVVVMPDHGGVSEALTSILTEKGVEVLVIDGTPAGEDLATQLVAWMSTGDIQGVYWLPALDSEPPLSQLDIASWKELLRIRVKLLAATMRALYEQIAPSGTFLVAATRMGGLHGYDDRGATAPMGGAVTGFAKAYKRERTDCLVKAVDLAAAAGPAAVAAALIDETERDPGAVEIGLQDDLRWAIGLQEQAVVDGQPGLALGPDSVFVVTGAAGSIVSAVVADLARASGGTFHLLDLAPEPDAADPDLERFVADRDGLKRELRQRMNDGGERPTPALIERALAATERRRAALDAIIAIEQAGGRAVYHSLDLRDTAAVAKALEGVREGHGRVDVLLHAAGLDVSHLLADKSEAEYDLVFDVKSDGWFNLLAAIGDVPLGATVCFSSVAGRFGNGGQTDYSAANDLLCKLTSSFRTTRPGTRGIAIDWTAWNGIGMASRGSIPKMMALAGIATLAPEVGVPWVRRELVCGSRLGEVLVAGELGVLTEEADADGGLDRAAVRLLTHGPMVGDVGSVGVFRPLSVETVLDPTAQGFLDDHRIDGVSLLPGVMSVEAFAEVAALLLPAWRVTSIEDVTFVAPFKFYRDEPRQFTVEAWLTPEANALVASCRLIGARTLPNQPEPLITTHVTGRVRLARQWQGGATTAPPIPPDGAAVGADDIYKVYFHGPTYQVLDRSWRQGDRQIGLMAEGLPAHHQPPELALLTAPRLLELCFQTAGIWELGSTGRLGLPQELARVTLLEPAQTVGRLYAAVEPRADHFDADVVDDSGRVRMRMEGYRTVALPTTIGPELLEPLRVAVS